MKTTVTLDEDVDRLLREAMQRSGKSFKATLNDALRVGLSSKPVQPKSAPFVVEARPMGLRPGIDPTSFNKLVDELEVDAYLEKVAKLGRQ